MTWNRFENGKWIQKIEAKEFGGIVFDIVEIEGILYAVKSHYY